MKVISGHVPKEQRRIIIESPHLIFLFDVFSSFIRIENDSHDSDIPVDFTEMEPDLTAFVEELVLTVLEKIDKDHVLSLITSLKTGEISVSELAVVKAIETMMKEYEDGVVGLMCSVLKPMLVEVGKNIVDEIIREGGFNTFQKLTIKTRRHVVVLC